jgi:hypothetical protein
MRGYFRLLLLVPACALGLSIAARCQDDTPPPSLGDVARQARQQKQQKDAQTASARDNQSKDAQTAAAPNGSAANKDSLTSKDSQNKDASAQNAPAKGAQPAKTAKKVVTNDEIPEHVGPTRTLPASSNNPTPDYPAQHYADGKIPPEYWQSRIQSQKNLIASLKSDIESTTASIQYAGANCVSNCVEWNERQRQKQQQVEAMKLQLEDAQKALESLQEMARKQGYGSSVYDP